MKNPTAFITKDGVSDLDLIAAARDLLTALERFVWEGHSEETEDLAIAAIFKARGVQS